MSTTKLYILLAIGFLWISTINISGQVPTYRSVRRVGKETFNLKPNDKNMYHYRANKDVRIVFSDRSDNKAYNTAYRQQTLQQMPIGEKLYIIGEKNDCFQVVKADHKTLGKPKGIFGFLFSAENHFKDGKNIPIMGWIPKSNILMFDHSFVYQKNNLPIRFRVGITSINRLFDLKRYVEGDSIKVFNEPFLKNSDNMKIAMGQIVYTYKYDDANRAALISDKPSINDNGKKVFGWIPADLISEAGTYHVLKTNGNTAFEKITTLSNDTLNIHPWDLHSDLLFVNDDMTRQINMNDSANIGYKVVGMPISVWDRTKNKLINVKGGDIMVSDISKMTAGQKTTNLHLLVFSDEKNNLKKFAGAFQSIALKFQPGHKYTFSMTVISNNGNIYFKPTDNFAKWLDFITNIPEKQTANEAGLEQAFKHLVENTNADKFEDNVMIILGSNQTLSLSSNIIEQLARRSFSISFIQLFGDTSEKGQDYLLKAKDIIDQNITSYNNFITNYIVDPKLLKTPLFIDCGEEDKVYLLDAPVTSLATGGIVFPESNRQLSANTISLVIDTVFSQIKMRNECLTNSLIQYEKKLGVIRSKPSHLLSDLIEKSNDQSKRTENMDRNSSADIYLLNVVIPDSIVEKQKEGYLMTLEETKTLIQSYRELLPIFSDSINRKEFRILRKTMNNQRRMINGKSFRKVLCRKSKLSELFLHKTGIMPNNDTLSDITIPKLNTDLYDAMDWNDIYNELIKKTEHLEEMFVKDTLEKIALGGTDYYFIEKKDLP